MQVKLTKTTGAILISACLGLLGLHISATLITNRLLARYRTLESAEWLDRHGRRVEIKPNARGYYARYLNNTPERVAELILKKEDKYFYSHPGVNPVSNLRAARRRLTPNNQQSLGSSTLTQQLAKILMGNEAKRLLTNKLRETMAAFALEYKLSKNEILLAYLNTIYLGNQIQGIQEASRYYFDTEPTLLSDSQIMRLLAAISSPTLTNPQQKKNVTATKALSQALKIKLQDDGTAPTPFKPLADYTRKRASFELDTLPLPCEKKCLVTVDLEVTERLGQMLSRSVEQVRAKGVHNGAIVVIKLPENELLAIVGSKDPKTASEGNQINMAVSPRPIGSTIKPFLYLKGFEQGLRPYTLIEDREYRYEVKDGFGFYPKNYDLIYRGPVTAEYALANSLNVPSVMVSNYVGQQNFNDFITKQLGHKTVQPIENYELSIALGGLEMSLLDLAHYFTIFGNHGHLKSLRTTKMNSSPLNQKAAVGLVDEPYVQMINKILSNRQVGIEQFGLASNLNLFTSNYALKTGTSQKFHDSWIVGYTPEFVVGVWVGNASNKATDGVSGQQGAGYIWSQVMEYILQSPYSTNAPFIYDKLVPVIMNNITYYSLPGENSDKHRDLLRSDSLILSPHHGDIYLLEENSELVLEAAQSVRWRVDDKIFSSGKTAHLPLTKVGPLTIVAENENLMETIKIEVRKK